MTIIARERERERGRERESNESELDDLRNEDWIPINAVSPRPVGRRFDSAVAFPDGAVTLESAPERYLPNPIALLHPPFGLDVTHFIPE